MSIETKRIMISILETLIYNSVDDLINNIETFINKLDNDNLRLLFFGNTSLECIQELENRWALNKQLKYHLDRTKKITNGQYEIIKQYFTSRIEK